MGKPVKEWMVMVPPRFRPSDSQLQRLRTHMVRRFPDMTFNVQRAPWNGDDISAIPCMGMVGDGEWIDRPDMPTDDDRRSIEQAAQEFDPAATYAPN